MSVIESCPSACCAGVENVCLDNLDSWRTSDGFGATEHTSFFGVVFEIGILLYSFTAVAIVADEHLVASLETLCVRWSVREDVAGASFMAFGSAAPEIIISAISTIKSVIDDHSDDAGGGGETPVGCGCDDHCGGSDDVALGIGAILGSGMIAFTFIPGCCGVAASAPLELKRRPLGRDILAYALALLVLMIALADNQIEAGESATMVLMYVVYLLCVIFSSTIRETYRTRVLGRAARNKSSFVTQGQESLNPNASDAALAVPALPAAPLPLASAAGLAPLTPLAATTQLQDMGPVQVATPLQEFATDGGLASSAYEIEPGTLTPLPAIGGEAAPTPLVATSTTRGERETVRMLNDAPSSNGVVDATAGGQANLEVGSGGGGGGDGEGGVTWADIMAADTWQAKALGITKLCGAYSLVPLKFALKYTCPECAHDGDQAKMYPVTLVTSFIWVAFMSTVIAAVVSRWGDILCIPASFLGMYVVAIGAEIPDTIQSVTVARRGYGSMAVSNSTGSQIINILIGLGLPWLIRNMAGQKFHVTGVGMLRLMAGFQFFNVSLYTSLLLLPTIKTWRPGDHSKATLSKRKGYVLLGTYVLVLIICAPILLSFNASDEPAGEPP